jgi:hypothetical protein
MHVAASAMGVARTYIVSGSFGTTGLIKSLRHKFVSCEATPIASHSSLAVTSTRMPGARWVRQAQTRAPLCQPPLKGFLPQPTGKLRHVRLDYVAASKSS